MSKRLPQQHKIDNAMREAAWDELVVLLIRNATQKQAADLLGFHPNTIKKWVADERFQLKLKRTRALIFAKTQDSVDKIVTEEVVNVKKLIEQHSTKAIQKIAGLMETSSSEAIQLKAAIDLADRGPDTSKTKKMMGVVGHAFLTPEVITAAAAAARALEENQKVGRVIEAVALEPKMAEPVEG